jgi:predicted acyl esterase
VFVTPPLTEDLVLAGPASADLWIRSSTPQADIGVTLSEVRPDGKETFIQAGVLRGSMRKPAPDATELWANHTALATDDEPMPVGRFTEARVEIFPFDQVIRKGSRIRLSVHTPGGDRPRWTYIVADGQKGATFDVGHSADTPSRLVLPATKMITGYPAELPPCPGLRAQPCRDYVEYQNTKAP